DISFMLGVALHHASKRSAIRRRRRILANARPIAANTATPTAMSSQRSNVILSSIVPKVPIDHLAGRYRCQRNISCNRAQCIGIDEMQAKVSSVWGPLYWLGGVPIQKPDINATKSNMLHGLLSQRR